MHVALVTVSSAAGVTVSKLPDFVTDATGDVHGPAPLRRQCTSVLV